MQADTDAIIKEFLTEKREWAVSHGTRFRLFEIAAANEAPYFTGIMSLGLEACIRRPCSVQLKQMLREHPQRF